MIPWWLALIFIAIAYGGGVLTMAWFVAASREPLE